MIYMRHTGGTPIELDPMGKVIVEVYVINPSLQKEFIFEAVPDPCLNLVQRCFRDDLRHYADAPNHATAVHQSALKHFLSGTA